MTLSKIVHSVNIRLVLIPLILFTTVLLRGVSCSRYLGLMVYNQAQPKIKNHPKVVYGILVARGGIEPPTQGFSITSDRPLSL